MPRVESSALLTESGEITLLTLVEFSSILIFVFDSLGVIKFDFRFLGDLMKDE